MFATIQPAPVSSQENVALGTKNIPAVAVFVAALTAFGQLKIICRLISSYSAPVLVVFSLEIEFPLSSKYS